MFPEEDPSTEPSCVNHSFINFSRGLGGRDLDKELKRGRGGVCWRREMLDRLRFGSDFLMLFLFPLFSHIQHIQGHLTYDETLKKVVGKPIHHASSERQVFLSPLPQELI